MPLDGPLGPDMLDAKAGPWQSASVGWQAGVHSSKRATEPMVVMGLTRQAHLHQACSLVDQPYPMDGEASIDLDLQFSIATTV